MSLYAAYLTVWQSAVWKAEVLFYSRKSHRTPIQPHVSNSVRGIYFPPTSPVHNRERGSAQMWYGEEVLSRYNGPSGRCEATVARAVRTAATGGGAAGLREPAAPHGSTAPSPPGDVRHGSARRQCKSHRETMPRALSRLLAPRREGPRLELFFSAGHAAAAAHRCWLQVALPPRAAGREAEPWGNPPRDTHAHTHRIFGYQYASEENPAQIKVWRCLTTDGIRSSEISPLCWRTHQLFLLKVFRARRNNGLKRRSPSCGCC